MTREEETIVQDALTRFLRDEYERDFQPIFDLSFQLLGAVISEVAEEVRLAFDHSARAVTHQDFELGLLSLARARRHIQRGKYVCLDTMINFQLRFAAEALADAEPKKRGQISWLKFELANLRKKKRTVSKIRTRRIGRLPIINDDTDEAYEVNNKLEMSLEEINRFLLLLSRDGIISPPTESDESPILTQPPAREADEPQGRNFAELLEWHLRHGTRSNYPLGRPRMPWTQREFAGLLDISPSAVSGWLHGKRVPSASHLDRIEVLLFGETHGRWLEEFRAMLGRQQTIRPKIPAPRPAAIEPVWIDDRLRIPKVPVATDLSVPEFEAALTTLRNVLRDLAADVSVEANIDRRFASFLNSCANSIPEIVPPQTKLFEIGHMDSVFLAYTRTVNDEWPSFLAARYHAVARQFDYTLRQSNAWRQFKRNALRDGLRAEQIEPAVALVKEVVAVLRQDEAVEFVDSEVPNFLETYLNQFEANVTGSTHSLDPIELGTEELATDLIESVNNVLKRIADAGLSALEMTKGAGSEVASIAKRTVGSFVGGFEKGAVSEAEKQGRASGRKAVRWLVRFATGGLVVSTGGGVTYAAYHAVSKLIANFPDAFGWFENLAKFVKALY
jgi:transcriptional regulator with XRE-family HTH domain